LSSSSSDDDVYDDAEKDHSGDDNSKASSSGELYNVDAIVGGPNKCGEYRVKWEGYSSDSNTWEKESGLPKELVEEYKRRCREYTKSSSDDDEPIVKRIQRGVYTA
jgi:hypothetical protein